MKSFYGGIFIEKSKLKEVGIEYPVKLEYYKNINEDELLRKDNTKYGISIVKTEYIPDNIKIEKKEIEHISNDEREINKILDLLKRNEVTPIGIEDVITDLRKQFF